MARTDAFLAPPAVHAADHGRQCPVSGSAPSGRIDPLRTWASPIIDCHGYRVGRATGVANDAERQFATAVINAYEGGQEV